MSGFLNWIRDDGSVYAACGSGSEKRRQVLQADQQQLWGIDLLNVPKSDIQP
ncbi:MAG: hypothetical protein R3B83_10725 [Nitrospirales bacterium]|nr:hypothetical protein [Nitrospirales bacterium]